MSYILDALRRADAERERGSVPGLHTQQVPVLPGDAQASRGAPPWLWLIGGALLVLEVLGVWMLVGGGETPATPAPAVATVPAPLPASTPAPAPISPMPVPTQTAQGPAQVPAQTAAQVPPRVVQAPPTQATPPVARKSTTTPASAAAPASSPKAEASADAKIYRQDELPDNIRRELPALTIGGSMYSESPGNRMLIVNGQLLHEGDSPAADVVLEQIKLKGAVLRYKGYRYQVNF